MSTWTEGSRLLGAIERGFDLAAVAWHASLARNAITWLRQSAARQRQAELIRLAGWFVLSAAATHVVLIGPRSLMVPWGSGLGWWVAMAMGVAGICRPEAVVAAWFRSRLARRKPS